MKNDNFFYLGYIQKAHKQGEKFTAVLDTDEPEKYDGMEVIFLLINNTHIPFFTRAFEVSGRTAIVEFEEDTTEGIEELIVGSRIFLPAEALPELKGNKFYYHEIRGFKVVDLNHGEIGSIDEVLDLPNQALIRVLDENGKEILIPVADEVIKKIDRKTETIYVETPEGLLDIYK